MKTRLYLIVCALLLSFTLLDETGEIRGRVIEKGGTEGVPFASVSANQGGAQILATVTDIDGNYTLKPLKAGKYNVKVSSVGYEVAEVKNVEVASGKVAFANVQLPKGVELKAVEIVEYAVPLIDNGSPSVQKTVTYEDIQPMPSRDINSLAGSASGVHRGKKGKDMNIRGSRSDATGYYVDGIKMRGRKNKYVVTNKADIKDEEYAKIIENNYFDALHNPLSTFSIDVDAASYSNVRRFLTGGTMPPPEAVRIEELVNYFDYDYPQPTDEHPFSIITEVSSCPWNEKHRLIHVGLQGKNISTERMPESNLVFLIDVSGSMTDADKLPLLKKAFHLLVDQLRREDKVAIVVYAGNAGLVLESTRGDDKDKIHEAIDKLEAGGSTAGGAGIQLAYSVAKDNFTKEGINRVILATDGDFNVGVSSDDELVSLIEKKREDGIFLSVLGFGTGNYKDSKMEQLADKGNGNFAYIDNIMEANKVFVKEMGGTLNTIAKDVKLQIEFNPAKVKAYRLVGYENRVLAAEDFNDDKKDAGELGSGHSVTALYEIIPAGSSEQINNIDSLKYQKTDNTIVNSSSNELMTVKFRYKAPKENTSKLIVHPLVDNEIALAATSDNFRFAAAVAEFGMLLRDSKFKGTSNYKDLLSMARASKGTDNEGYRAEFIRLAEMAELLTRGTANAEEKE